MTRLRFAALAAACLCACSAAGAAPVVRYQAVDLMASGAGAQSSGFGIANGGLAAGSVATANTVIQGHGARFGSGPAPGAPQDLGALASNGWSIGRSINAAGQVAGYAQASPPYGIPHATLWTGGTLLDINPTGGTYSQAFGINNAGTVVGSFAHYFDGFGGSITSAFVRAADGQVKELMPQVGSIAAGYAINESGQVAGVTTFDLASSLLHGLFYDGSTMHDIGTLAQGHNSRANAVNDRGQAVGAGEVDGGAHVVLYENGQLRDLGVLAGTEYSEAFGINDDGVIVGNAYSATNRHGFVAFDQVLYDLADLISGGFDGWSVYDLRGINDEGQIVGTAINERGELHAFRFDPTAALAVPEPGALALVLAAGGAALLAMARRRRG